MVAVVLQLSGMDYRSEVVPKFAAIVGTLEIVGSAFHSFKDERNKLIETLEKDNGKDWTNASSSTQPV